MCEPVSFHTWILRRWDQAGCPGSQGITVLHCDLRGAPPPTPEGGSPTLLSSMNSLFPMELGRLGAEMPIFLHCTCGGRAEILHSIRF